MSHLSKEQQTKAHYDWGRCLWLTAEASPEAKSRALELARAAEDSEAIAYLESIQVPSEAAS